MNNRYLRQQIAAAGLILGGMFGRFGDLSPRDELRGPQVQGYYRGGKNGKTRRPTKQSQRARSGHGKKMHRRSYLSGKPGLR